MQNPVICILCGLPGSGKSTLCQRLLSMPNSIPTLHISYDNLIGWLNLSDSDRKWKEARASVTNFVERIIEYLRGKRIHPPFDCQDYELLNETHLKILTKKVMELIAAKVESCCLLIDDNMFYKSMRKVYYQLAVRSHAGACVIFLPCSLDVCTKRLQNRPGNQIDNQTLARINNKMEIPDEKTIPSGTGLLNFDYHDDWSKTCQLLTSLIKDCSEKPLLCIDNREEELAREENRILNAASLAHQADICMRKIVKQCFADSHALPVEFVNVVKNNTKLISMAKKAIIKQINLNQLDLSFFHDNDHEDVYKIKFEAELIQLLIAYVENH